MWNLETAKKYLGYTGDPTDPSDEDIQKAMDTTLSSIETSLQRKILREREVETFHFIEGYQLFCKRYPIERIDLLDGNVFDDTHEDFSTVHVEPLPGIVHSDTFLGSKTVELEYTGGYGDPVDPNTVYPLPADLERVMWSAFMIVWEGTDSATGGPAGPGSGDVKSITVFDAFKIDYDIGSISSTGSSDEDIEAWGWLAPHASTLAFYQRGISGVDVGFA